MMDSHAAGLDGASAKTALTLLQELPFEMLLATDGRTTELLETLLREKLVVTVLRQEKLPEGQVGAGEGGAVYVRESVLSGEKSRFIVSHNIALVSAKHLPAPLFENIASKQEGIGKTIGSSALRSFRNVIESGRVNAEDAVDLFGRPLRLRLEELSGKVPYKRYEIYFGPHPGIRMLEYYHPDLVERRLKQELRG